MGIHMCFLSNRNDTILLSTRYGTQVWRKEVETSGDLTKGVFTYRIEWRPDYVAFFLGNARIGGVKVEDQPIPDQGMNIKVAFLPLKRPRQPYKNPIVALMSLYFIFYKKADIAPEHIELFTRTTTRVSHLGLIAISLVLIGIMGAFIIYRLRTWDNTSDSIKEYVLLNDFVVK